MNITSSCQTIISDLTSPAAVYLRLRDKYSRVFLFESSDYHGAGDCRSFVCCDPIAEFVVNRGVCSIRYGTEVEESIPVKPATGLRELLARFMGSFHVREPKGGLPKGVASGAFGHICFDAIPYMEQITFTNKAEEQHRIPEAHFTVFRYVIAFNPFRNEAHIVENVVDGESNRASESEAFLRAAFEGDVKTFPFSKIGEETGMLSDEEFLALVGTCKKHIARGDVFQIVPSRRYLQRYEGDDFQVYRALRSINPSPYLFYCDYGSYRLFGSSPECQIAITNGTAAIYPIAGTYPRTGNDEADRERAKEILRDPKEMAEHAMLVDLARNDLSRACANVRVERLNEVQYFSHLIHIVSKVVGTLKDPSAAIPVVCDSFPLGTLSGAPKHRAMQLIDANEPHLRGHYGGCIGCLAFNGDVILGIIIRSFLSINQTLVYQVGMGVVHDSVPETELEEVHTKIRALRLAMDKASTMER